MKFKRILTILTSALLLSGVAYAQGVDEVPVTPDKKEEKKTDVLYDIKLGGVIWMNYHLQMDKLNDVNAFEIERAYVILAKRFNDYFSANIVWDVTPQTYYNQTAGTIQYGTYTTYLKMASLTMMRTFGPVTLGLKTGIIDTPYFITESRNEDYLMNRDPLEQAQVDQLFDLGGGIIAKLYEYADFYFTITEGEGYRRIGTKMDRGKAYSGRLSGYPIKGLAIDLFGQANLLNGKDMEGTVQAYAGAGISYKIPLIRTGMNFFNLFATSSVPNDPMEARNNDWLIDFWTNINLEPVSGYPFLLWAMFDYYYDTDKNGTPSNEPFIVNTPSQLNTAGYYEIGVGFGYMPHPLIQTNLYYSYRYIDKKGPVNTLYIKAAAKF